MASSDIVIPAVGITALAAVVISLIAGVTFYNTQELRVVDTLDKPGTETCVKAVYMMDNGAMDDATTKRLAICRGYKVQLPND